MRALLICPLMVLVGCASTQTAASRREPARSAPAVPSIQSESGVSTGKLRSLSELLKQMESSPVTYSIRGLDSLTGVEGSLAEALWPPLREPFTMPTVVKDATGEHSVTELPANGAADAWVEQGEVPFNEKKYAEAEALYRKALEVDPEHYPALLYIGDTLLWTKQLNQALAMYERAIAANPFDHRGYFFRSTVLRNLGRMGEARESLAWALVNRPRYPPISKMLEKCPECVDAQRSGGDRIVPRAFARKTAEGVEIYADPENVAWFGYGVCKGFWLGEPEVREEGRRFSSDEERECLAALLTAYDQQLEEHPEKRSPEIERIYDVVKAGFATELILYELASRVDPHFTLTLDEKIRTRLHAYVLRFVMPKAKVTAGR